jgi:hypothetical protein
LWRGGGQLSMAAWLGMHLGPGSNASLLSLSPPLTADLTHTLACALSLSLTRRSGQPRTRVRTQRPAIVLHLAEQKKILASVNCEICINSDKIPRSLKTCEWFPFFLDSGDYFGWSSRWQWWCGSFFCRREGGSMYV